jgi:hypothetical protein
MGKEHLSRSARSARMGIHLQSNCANRLVWAVSRRFEFYVPQQFTFLQRIAPECGALQTLGEIGKRNKSSQSAMSTL